MKKGFTLIETLIYIALFTILIGAGFSTAFGLIQSGESLGNKNITNSELDFVLRKIDWAMNGVETINIPNFGTPISSVLSVTKYDGTTIQIRKNATSTEINENGNWIPLTSANVEVEALGFQYISGEPNGVIATTTINKISATTTKYIRHD